MKSWAILAAGLAVSAPAWSQSPASDWSRSGDARALLAGWREDRPAAAQARRTPAAAKRWAAPKHAPACVLATVADMMGITLRPDIPAPAVRLESDTPLERFQDAVEPQWGLRPGMFLNAYVPSSNEVFLTADASYYGKLKRFLDDSLAHEYVHFFQVQYKKVRLEDFSDAEEGEAVQYQTEFRDRYMTPGVVPPRCR
ncbi:MAG: hypothetical protein HY927_04320 [Elusimicrobia bacterium]|nr:hypothetical protein [Elusimicrobiota bacterium]